MNGIDIAKRYAKAFFEIANEAGQLEAYYSELKAFTSLVNDTDQLRDYLANPMLDEESKKNVVAELTEKMSFSPITKNFLCLLVEKRRIDLIVAIVKSYEELMDKALNKARVDVRTAFPLTNVVKEKLHRGLEELTKKTVVMSVCEDTSLLGGIVVRIGDTLYDGSVKTQLKNISNLLGEEL